MRNAVIRKKRLLAERIVDDYMRMPRRIMTGIDVRDLEDIDWAKIKVSPIYAL